MTYRVVIIPTAEGNIQAVARYLLDRSKSSRAAITWVKSIRAKIQTLRTSPFSCPIDFDQPGKTDLRILMHGKAPNQYQITFTVVGDEVRVLIIRHAARDQADGINPDDLD